MILTLTLNPAVDVTINTEQIIYDDRVYISNERFQAGGKGVNAARVLHDYGAPVESIAPFGGAMGQRFQKLLAESQIPVTLIPVRGETRRNLAVIDDQGLTLKLDQRGSPLSARELERIEVKLSSRLPSADWITLTGSLPPGVPPDYYARLIRLAQNHGVETLLDTSGEALPAGLRAGPSLAKPNRPEAEKLLNRSLLTEADFVEAATEIRAMGPKRVILSLGGQGAVASWEGVPLRATPPAIEFGSPIGAGDVVVATCVWRLTLGDPFEEAFAWAIAAGAVSASKPGLGSGGVEEVERMRERIEIREVVLPARS